MNDAVDCDRKQRAAAADEIEQAVPVCFQKLAIYGGSRRPRIQQC